MGNKVIKCFLLFLTFMFLSGCASDGWYLQRERERFLKRPAEERERAREWCKDHEGCSMNIHRELTPKEQERLKHKDSWKYKIRSWYYGIWK
jgi:hypothetical protein